MKTAWSKDCSLIGLLSNVYLAALNSIGFLSKQKQNYIFSASINRTFSKDQVKGNFINKIKISSIKLKLLSLCYIAIFYWLRYTLASTISYWGGGGPTPFLPIPKS